MRAIEQTCKTWQLCCPAARGYSGTRIKLMKLIFKDFHHDFDCDFGYYVAKQRA